MADSKDRPVRPVSRRGALRRIGAGFGALLAPSCVADGDFPRCGAGPPVPDGGAASGPADAPDAFGAQRLLDSIDTIVVVMMENRSFDHYLGALRLDSAYPAARLIDGLSGHETNPDSAGQPVPVSPLSDDVIQSPPHDWDSAHRQFDGGKNDGFVVAYGGPLQGQSMGYYDRAQLPVLYALADQFTVCDRWFSSVMGPTWPNRFYLHAATSFGLRSNLPIVSEGPPTVWERLHDRCLNGLNYSAGAVSWYSGAFVGKSVAGNDPTVPIERFFGDASAGTLPSFSLIDPDFHFNDDHPPSNILLGQAFLASIYQALAQGPHWQRSLLVITYDEHGGFYDHVAPPTTVDDQPGFQQLGFRVPTVVIGPSVRRGFVDSTVLEHVSVAATLASRFGIASLGRRMDAARDLSSCIDPALVDKPAPPPTLPRVRLSARALRGLVPHSGQPELDLLVQKGRVPAARIDPRPPTQRLAGWLRLAQELDVLQVV